MRYDQGAGRLEDLRLVAQIERGASLRSAKNLD